MQYAQSWVNVYSAGLAEDRVIVRSSGRYLFPPQTILPPRYLQPCSKTGHPYSSDTDRRLKMGRRRPSKLGDSAPPEEEEELREQEEV